jgi:integrase/recombinase XerD
MERVTHPPLSFEGQYALGHYAYALKQVEDLSAVTICNCLSDLRQFMAWCESHWDAVNATGTLRDRTIITLLLHTGLRAQELCTLTCKHVHLSKRNGILRIVGKRKKVRDVPLNVTARSILRAYLETLPAESCYLFPSEKTQRALTERVLGHLITKYARRAKQADVSPHDLRHRFGYRMAEVVPLHRLAQIMGHDSLDTTMLSIRGTKQDLQQDVEKISWA